MCCLTMYFEVCFSHKAGPSGEQSEMELIWPWTSRQKQTSCPVCLPLFQDRFSIPHELREPSAVPRPGPHRPVPALCPAAGGPSRALPRLPPRALPARAARIPRIPPVRMAERPSTAARTRVRRWAQKHRYGSAAAAPCQGYVFASQESAPTLKSCVHQHLAPMALEEVETCLKW